MFLYAHNTVKLITIHVNNVDTNYDDFDSNIACP